MTPIGSGTTYSQGDVFLARVPFSDITGIKQRPVLVLSVDAYNRTSRDVIVCGITSNLGNVPYSIRIDNASFIRGNILTPSLIKANHLFTLDKATLIRRFGTVNAATINQTKAVLNTLL